MAKSKKETDQVLKSFIHFRKSEQPLPNYEIQPGDVMLDARYIKQSATLIQDALQKGFDVLQMANGDIVTTGTKTVVYKYTWDEDSGKLKRSSVISKKGAKEDELEPEEDIVSEALENVE